MNQILTKAHARVDFYTTLQSTTKKSQQINNNNNVILPTSFTVIASYTALYVCI